MNCPNCGSPLEDGAGFCGNCGAKIDGGAQGAAPDVVFCPNCGKPLSSADIFCDNCGYQMNGTGAAPSGGLKGKLHIPAGLKPKLKFIIPAAVAAVALVGGGAFALMHFGGAASGGSPSKLVYYKDQSMMMIDLKKKKAEPVELTDSFSDEDYLSMSYRNFLSKDGRYVLYAEDYDGDTYDLYMAKVSKPEEGAKVDSKVSSHMILDDNTILYRKKNTLFHYNGKESVKLAKDVVSFMVDEKQKNICWKESDKGEYSYYYQDIAQKKEAVELTDLEEGDDFYTVKGLERFYLLKGDNLYALDNKGNKEKIAKDVMDILSYNSELGMFYYIKGEQKEIPYSEFVYDDTNDMTEYNRERLAEEKFTMMETSLYLFDGKTEQLVSEQFDDSQSLSISEHGQYALYYELPDVENVEVAWSAMKNDSWSSAVQQGIREERKLVLSSGAEKTAEFEDLEYCRSSRMNAKAGKLYLYTTDEEYDDGTIWVTSLTGQGAGKLEEYDDADDARLMFADEGGLYYLKDCDEEGGDLYYDKKEIAGDVINVKPVGEGSGIVMASDYDTDDRSFSVSFRSGKKIVPAAEDVNACTYMENGCAVLLIDVNDGRREGELAYFNGRELRTLDDDVYSFVTPRDGSQLYAN
ncbi:MAG: zinc ribbon domain-containing protein [Lachnospiraceae bacterium]|nr:zinc ribbon domain-containing protein [Lachnospiraceae bacterium]